MLNLWNDSRKTVVLTEALLLNLYQVYDALVGQWPTSVREWARRKVLNLPTMRCTVAVTEITIHSLMEVRKIGRIDGGTMKEG
jgi:hypothetical protein